MPGTPGRAPASFDRFHPAKRTSNDFTHRKEDSIICVFSNHDQKGTYPQTAPLPQDTSQQQAVKVSTSADLRFFLEYLFAIVHSLCHRLVLASRQVVIAARGLRKFMREELRMERNGIQEPCLSACWGQEARAERCRTEHRTVYLTLFYFILDVRKNAHEQAV